MRIKRAPLRGAKNILLIILTLTLICSIFENTRLNKINHILNTAINDQAIMIKNLNDEKENLEIQVAELKERNIETVQSKSESNKNTGLGKFKISAYCPCTKCCGQWAGGNTASGTIPTAGRTIAVDPRIIPLGSKVVIDGNTYIAEDTGSAIKGKKIDMYFNSHSEALAWGIKYKDVSIVN